MCRAIGVDPLSAEKGAFKDLMSDSKEYYWSLAIQVQSICLVLKPKNGGFLSVPDLITYLKKISSKNSQVQAEDIFRAVDILHKDLGSTFKILEGTDIICCVPVTMSSDYKEVLSTMDISFTKTQLMSRLGYSDTRADQVLIQMLENGLLCEDAQVPASDS